MQPVQKEKRLLSIYIRYGRKILSKQFLFHNVNKYYRKFLYLNLIVHIFLSKFLLLNTWETAWKEILVFASCNITQPHLVSTLQRWRNSTLEISILRHKKITNLHLFKSPVLPVCLAKHAFYINTAPSQNNKK